MATTSNRPALFEVLAPSTADFDCVADDGRFCVVRASDADAREGEDVTLAVTWEGHEHRFVPVALAPDGVDHAHLDFLLPSWLLQRGSFELAAGSHRHALPAPDRLDLTGLSN